MTFVRCHYGNESSILVVTEGCQLTMWDLRVKENGGCVKRICGSPGDILHATSFSPTGNIAVGGADRTVTIYDPRRWSAMSRWTNCSKYEVSLADAHFSWHTLFHHKIHLRHGFSVCIVRITNICPTL